MCLVKVKKILNKCSAILKEVFP